MAFPDDVFPVEDRCEICGVRLEGETVIQEFADGSLARLCPECAAGAALGEHPNATMHPAAGQEQGGIVWPDEPAPVADTGSADADPLERTRELLMPVTDLIALQNEMQDALERLAGSLERFAAEYISEAQSKSVAESRLRMLEHELDETRARLHEAEHSLTAVVGTAAAADALFDAIPEAPPVSKPAWESGEGDQLTTEPVTVAPPVAPPVAPLDTPLVAPPLEKPEAELDGAEVSAVEFPVAETPAYEPPMAEPVEEPPAEAPVVEPVEASATEVPEAAPVEEPAAEEPVGAVPVAEEPVGTAAPGPATHELDDSATFRIDEVQATQRYYNESPFIERIRDVHRSLGKPKANLTKVPGGEPRAIVTIAWDIVWYQYLVYLRRDLPASQSRVVLHREGMDLDELAYYFKEKNAVVNNDGRLDASELEVRLLSDPSALITDLSPEERRLLEDATEEIWSDRTAPEFKWDD